MFPGKAHIRDTRLVPLAEVLSRLDHVVLPANCFRIEHNAISRTQETVAEIDIFVSKGPAICEVAIECSCLEENLTVTRKLSGEKVMKSQWRLSCCKFLRPP